jgi:hypothetical protein
MKAACLLPRQRSGHCGADVQRAANDGATSVSSSAALTGVLTVEVLHVADRCVHRAALPTWRP